MALPKQVARQAKVVEELEQSLAETQVEAQAAEEPSEPVSPPQAASSQEVAPPAPAPVADDAETWRKRYETLQGMFNAEVPRLRSRIEELESVSAKPQAQPTPAFVEAPVPDSEDVDAYGEELVNMIRRQATAVTQAYVSQIVDAKIAEFAQKLSGVEQKAGAVYERTFLSDLAVQVPDWEALNTDPDFLAWLAEVDPMTGFARKVYLDDAYGVRDVNRTAAVFTAYKTQKGIVAQPAPQSKPSLERQVSPGKAKATAAPAADPSQRTWTMAEITAFYDDVRRGKYRGREAEAGEIEKQIDLAVAQARVR